MSAVERGGVLAALGEPASVEGFALAGVRVVEAADAEAVRSAWRTLPPEVAVVILTPRAAEALGSRASDPRGPLTVVLPS